MVLLQQHLDKLGLLHLLELVTLSIPHKTVEHHAIIVAVTIIFIQCPQHVMGFSDKQSISDDDLEEEVYVSDEEMVFEAKRILADEQLDRLE